MVRFGWAGRGRFWGRKGKKESLLFAVDAGSEIWYNMSRKRWKPL